MLSIAQEFLQSRDAAPEQQVGATTSSVPPALVPAASPNPVATPAGRPTYTVREAAHLLGMKESALRERIRMRRVSVLRVGQRVLVRSEELERLLAQGVVTSWSPLMRAGEQ